MIIYDSHQTRTPPPPYPSNRIDFTDNPFSYRWVIPFSKPRFQNNYQIWLPVLRSDWLHSSQGFVCNMHGQMDKWTNGQMDKWTNGQMDKWTNGQMDKWTNGQMDKWTNGQMDKWTNGQMDKWTNGQMDKWTNGQMDKWTNGQMDKWTNGQIDGQMDKWTNRWTNGQMDKWTNGQMDKWTNGQMWKLNLLSSITLVLRCVLISVSTQFSRMRAHFCEHTIF